MSPVQVGILAGLGVVLLAVGAGIAALLIDRVARRRRRRTASPVAPVTAVLPRAVDAPTLQFRPVRPYPVTTLPERRQPTPYRYSPAGPPRQGGHR